MNNREMILEAAVASGYMTVAAVADALNGGTMPEFKTYREWEKVGRRVRPGEHKAFTVSLWRHTDNGFRKVPTALFAKAQTDALNAPEKAEKAPAKAKAKATPKKATTATKKATTAKAPAKAPAKAKTTPEKVGTPIGTFFRSESPEWLEDGRTRATARVHFAAYGAVYHDGKAPVDSVALADALDTVYKAANK